MNYKLCVITFAMIAFFGLDLNFFRQAFFYGIQKKISDAFKKKRPIHFILC